MFHLHKLAKRSAPAERIGRSTSIVVSSVIIAFHNHNTSPFLLEATTSAVYLVYYCVLCCVLLRHVCIFSVARTDSAKCTLLSPLLALCCVGETNIETSVERKSDSRHEFTRSIRPSRTDWTRDRETWSASKHARFLSRASGTAWAVVPMTWMFPSAWNHYRPNESGEWPFSRLTRGEENAELLYRCWRDAWGDILFNFARNETIDRELLKKKEESFFEKLFTMDK